MKVVVFDMEPWEREGFETLGDIHEVRLVSEPLDESNASEYADAEIVSGFIYSDFSAEVLDLLPRLRMIATRSTGFDHVAIDVCRERGIVVCNVPTYGSATVAEHVFGLLLTISHRLEEAVDRTRKGDFSPRGLQGFDLYGKTIGIVGTGEIGQEVIRIANGFAMDVIGFNTREAVQRISDTTRENIVAFASGEPIHVVE